jgi:hypothetical protein
MQKDSIASHLAQVRQLLPGMNAVQAAQTKTAITGDPDTNSGRSGAGRLGL